MHTIASGVETSTIARHEILSTVGCGESTPVGVLLVDTYDRCRAFVAEDIVRLPHVLTCTATCLFRDAYQMVGLPEDVALGRRVGGLPAIDVSPYGVSVDVPTSPLVIPRIDSPLEAWRAAQACPVPLQAAKAMVELPQ